MTATTSAHSRRLTPGHARKDFFSAIKINLHRLLLTTAIMFSFTSCDMREARLKSFEKDKWIQVALGTPLPSGISDLEGIGDTWQGFGCHFRLRIDSEELLKHLSENEYEEKEVADFVRYFTIDPRFEKYFLPPWNPDLGSNRKIYVRNPSDYQTVVLVSSTSDIVHVWTGGSHSPGPFPKNKQAPMDDEADPKDTTDR